MQRELKRVPLDFDYPLNKVWHGYNVKHTFRACLSEGEECCTRCKEMARLKGIPMTHYGCPDNEVYYSEVQELLDKLCEPPVGEGYQLWETVSEGSPMSPVFASLDELSEWCSSNVTGWRDCILSKEEWLEFFLAKTGGVSGHDND